MTYALQKVVDIIKIASSDINNTCTIPQKQLI